MCRHSVGAMNHPYAHLGRVEQARGEVEGQSGHKPWDADTPANSAMEVGCLTRLMRCIAALGKSSYRFE